MTHPVMTRTLEILGFAGVVGAPLTGLVAYDFYSAGKLITAAIWGTMALIWTVGAIINLRTARRRLVASHGVEEMASRSNPSTKELIKGVPSASGTPLCVTRRKEHRP